MAQRAPIGPGRHDGSVQLRPSSVAAWAGVELRRPLAGGARNHVVLADRGSERLVVRHSGRSAPALDWELDLLEFLDAHGIGVPRPVSSDDGRRHVDGVLIYRFIDGRPPRDRADWQRAVAVLTAIHEMTDGWPQRPGFASSRQLLSEDRGGDVRLDAMPVAAEALSIAGVAWEAATCWTAEPDYAARRLAELYARVAVKPHDAGTDAGDL
jgi:Ser/Thr protein kinase RdoA (MazF antagonist)